MIKFPEEIGLQNDESETFMNSTEGSNSHLVRLGRSFMNFLKYFLSVYENHPIDRENRNLLNDISDKENI